MHMAYIAMTAMQHTTASGPSRGVIAIIVAVAVFVVGVVGSYLSKNK